ncbi:Signal transduction histidine kinase [Methanophagales archaeon]|jgi:PAS domain S-box-containing protein|nr:Signal transduction histidine kinase [Methanophagales archaeon]
MKKGDSGLEETERLIVLIAILACALLDVYITFFVGKVVVYTHFFYIPIILAGIWYYRKAAYVALFLGAFHVLTTYIYAISHISMNFNILILEAMQRAAIFLLVAYVVGFVSENHAKSQLQEEKRRTEELRKNEEKYRSLVESTEDSVYLVDRDCKYLFLNEKHLSRLELTGKQFQGRAYSDFHSAGDAKQFSEKVKYVFDIGTSVQHEYRENGKGCYLKTLSPVKDPETGAVTAVTVVSKDISGLKRTERELIETKDYLNNIIESSADTITVVDMNGIVRDWNKSAEGMMGYHADEVIGSSNRKFFVVPEEADRIMALVQREGKIKNYRAIMLRKEGELVLISMSAALLRDKNDVPIGTIRVSRDITKEVELEKQIKAERDNLKLISESMADGVYLVSEDYKVEFMNKILRDEFGDRVGGICYKVFHDREKPCPQCKSSVVMTGKTVRWEWYARRTNKTYDLIETPLTNIDGSISKLTIFRDVTERKKADEVIQKLNKALELRVVDLEAVTRMKTEFLSVTSHELRTPLTPMKAQLQMLQEGYMGEMNEKQGNSIEIIQRNLTRLDTLINDILDISRIEAGRIKISLGPISINDAVKEAIKMQEPFAEEKAIKVSTKLAKLPNIIGDAERLRQVIGNLLNNAIKFSDISADMVVKTERVGDNVLFSVTDYGIGISKEDIDKLFKPFSQIDPSFRREHGGTGLGLAIAKGLIQAHNGKIWVESELAKGSTFFFSIPIKQEITEKEAPYFG